MSDADLALAAVAILGLLLRLAGLLLGGVLRADHPVIAWASAVSVATLASFVTLALVVPAGLLGTVPWPARLAGVVAGAAVYLGAGRRLLPSMLAGLAALVLARSATG
jgi:hypothetical protein